MKQEYIVIYTTFPDLRTAKKIIGGLVQSKLAACGNIFKLSSIYHWKGKVEKNSEYGAFIKTIKAKYTAVETYIKKYHPYEVPEVIAWTIDKGSSKYLAWVRKESS